MAEKGNYNFKKIYQGNRFLNKNRLPFYKTSEDRLTVANKVGIWYS